MPDFNPALKLPIKWSIGDNRFDDDDDSKVLMTLKRKRKLKHNVST